MKKKIITVTHVSYSVSKQTASYRIHSELSKLINSRIFVAAKSVNSNSIIQPVTIHEKISARFGIIREFLLSKLIKKNNKVYFSYNIGPLFFSKILDKKIIHFKN